MITPFLIKKTFIKLIEEKALPSIGIAFNQYNKFLYIALSRYKQRATLTDFRGEYLFFHEIQTVNKIKKEKTKKMQEDSCGIATWTKGKIE